APRPRAASAAATARRPLPACRARDRARDEPSSARRAGSARSPWRSASGWSWRPSAPARLLLPGVVLERAGRRELTHLVGDHRLGHVYGNVLAAVVNREGVADHLGCDRRSTRPRLDDLLVARLVESLHLLGEMRIDERTLLQAARHRRLPPRAPRATTADD